MLLLSVQMPAAGHGGKNNGQSSIALSSQHRNQTIRCRLLLDAKGKTILSVGSVDARPGPS